MTNEEAKKAGFRTASGALYVYWCIENGHIYVRSCDACALTGNDFPTRAKAREALRKRKENEEVNRKSRFIDNFVQPMQEHLSSKSKADAEHAKWLDDTQSQTTPITPEQVKMLSRDDVVFMYDIASLGISGIRGYTAINDNSYVTSPLFFTEQAARDRLNEVMAAQAALDKAKAEAEPLEWCEREDGDLIQPDSGDDISIDGGKTWKPQWKSGVIFDTVKGDLRARYRNPLWLAKHGRKGMVFNNNTNRWEPDTSALDELVKQAQELHMGYETDKPYVESHETQVGETQTKEVVTDETQPTILEEAAKCVTGPRRRDYGTPDENFSLIASLWSVQLKHEVTPMQVALCLILLKVARQSNSPKRDNLVDIAGYAQCASDLKGAK